MFVITCCPGVGVKTVLTRRREDGDCGSNAYDEGGGAMMILTTEGMRGQRAMLKGAQSLNR